MISGKNMVTLVGRLGADPEAKGDSGNVLTMRLAVDYAGSDDRNPESKTGWFRVTYFLNNDSPNAKFVKSQIDAGNLKKGSSVHIVGRLDNRQYSIEEQRREDIRIIAENIDYYGYAERSEESTSSPRGEATKAAAPDDF